ncbi:hypothetical protein GF369_00025 [Candidatus Peregrinibacteria bacterium]|nr:hypothetical protein [Candidatus Peregrinibacteria bacterium]
MKKNQLLSAIKKYIKQCTFTDVSAALFYAFVFLMPFQIDVLAYSSTLFKGGNFNPFTSVFYYLADIVFLLALIAWGVSLVRGEYKKKLTYGKWLIGVILLALIIVGEWSVFVAEDQFLSLLALLRLVQMIVMYFYMANDVTNRQTVMNVFIASVSVQAVIALLQYVTQGSLGIHVLGESVLSPTLPGVAKMNIDGVNTMRAYGTFPHPNIMAGYLVTAIMFTFYHIRKKEYIAYPVLVLLLAALLLTFSRSAMLALFIAGLFFVSVKEVKISLKYILLGVSLLGLFIVIVNAEQTILHKLLFVDRASFDQRVFYFSIAKSMMYAHPLGVGLSNFTLLMPDYTFLKLAPWDYQPVHNMYMLLANELGLPGFIIFALLLVVLAVYLFSTYIQRKQRHRGMGLYILATLIALAIIGLFDHYLISLYQGQLLLFLVIGLAGHYIMKESHS